MLSRVKRMLATVPPAILALALLSGVGIAGWAMIVQNTSNVQIQSGQRLDIQTTLTETLVLSAEGDGASGEETIVITNQNGGMDCVLTYGLDVTDTEDECTDYADDLSMVVRYQSANRTSGDTVNLGSGGNFFDVYYEAIEWSCPGDAVATFTMDCS